MSRRPFFVGVGAQRAGTTWIGHFLRRQPGVRFSPNKETCYFDTKHVPERAGALHIPLNTKLAVLGLGNYTRRYPLSGARLWYHYYGMRKLNDQSYRAYFDELARNSAVAGEISPSYAMLDEATIKQIDTLLDQPNYFFIMRNPVDRLLSQYSFLSSRRGLQAPTGSSLSAALLALCSKSLHVDYSKSLASYSGAVPRARFKVLFTEHLFDPDRTQHECDSLCDFLGIDCGAAPSDRPVNRAPEIRITQDTRAKLVAKLADAYDAAERVTQKPLPPSWQADQELMRQA